MLAENEDLAFRLLNEDKKLYDVFGQLKPHIERQQTEYKEILSLKSTDFKITPDWQNKVLDVISKSFDKTRKLGTGEQE